MSTNGFLILGTALPILLWSLIAIAWYICGLFVLVKLDDIVIDKMQRSPIPNNMLYGIVAWTIWPLLIVIWAYRLANHSHLQDRRW